MEKKRYERGIIMRVNDIPDREVGGAAVREFVSPGNGSEQVTAFRVTVPGGRAWAPAQASELETIGVTFAGAGSVRIAGEEFVLARAGTFYAPAGRPFRLRASATEPLIVYLWQCPLPSGCPTSAAPRLTSSLWNDETTFTPVAGQARMHFVHWPGTGSAVLSLHAGIQRPGQTFNVHTHPISEELFIAFEGMGECHLDGIWQPMHAGDVLYAPALVPHGVRNPHTGPGAGTFVTCGGPTPFDVNFYRAIGATETVR